MARQSKAEPAYLTIYKQLRRQIEKGDYPCGAKLPSKRVTADRYRVSVITVEHAYAVLEDEGYVEARQRRGYFVIYREGDHFSVGEPAPLPAAPRPQAAEDLPFSVYARTVRRVLTDRAQEVLVKSPPVGCEALRRAIARYLSRSRGMAVDAGQVVIGSGSEYLYGLILQMLGPCRRYAIEDPTYEKIERVYAANGIAPRRLPLGVHGIRSRALAECDADVLQVTPYRSFPTGVTATPAKKREYLRWAEQGERWLIEDDFESEFSPTVRPVDTLYALSGGERVIYLNTFSKTVAPAVRVGYMVLPLPLVETFEKTVGFYSCTVPALEQYVLAALIDSGDFERHINRVRRRRQAEKPDPVT
ncbi:MAG: PLP-dependent aminotransferase family protein [Acutalibacteraceae bacterium]|jgi:GntR family transcriptional regulator/MocR family aminotransferase